MEIATFAAGCFWGVEDRFRKTKGVISTSVGYTGGHWPHPCYLDVCARVTGHAEAVRVEYNLQQVSYEELLEQFWQCHDPTQLNRQGADRGEQYRSAIFYHTPAQERAARQSKQRLQQSGTYEKEIVTQILPAQEFYLAEADHQQYLEKKRKGIN
jgi:peptide-methionine (S)-S-oxide reductase